jgi:hypothetical protein
MNINTDIVLAILTTVPAIAWFLNAFVKLFSFYKKHKDTIKNTAMAKVNEAKQDVKFASEQAKKLSQTVKGTVKHDKHPPQPPTEGSGPSN